MQANDILVLQMVKARLRLNDDLDVLLSSYVQEIGHRIMHYCNLSAIPEALTFTWASMVIDAIRIEQSTWDEIADTIDERVSLSIGDTSTSPSKGDEVTSTSKSIIDDVVLNYRVDLNRYRKLWW